MRTGTLWGSQATEDPSSRLEVTVVHWGDNALRARAASVLAVNEAVHDRLREIMNLRVDRAMIFSWAKTMGKDNPSEARKMYDIFLKRLKVLNASGRIPWGIRFPTQTEWADHWNIEIGNENVTVYLEEDSVDTEDNAERSAKIIQEIFHAGAYGGLVISPLSSGFHMKRIKETFERYTPEWSKPPTDPASAESILKNAPGIAGRYRRYWELKEKSIWPKTKFLEVILRIASRFEWGRKKIREITHKRVAE